MNENQQNQLNVYIDARNALEKIPAKTEPMVDTINELEALINAAKTLEAPEIPVEEEEGENTENGSEENSETGGVQGGL